MIDFEYSMPTEIIFGKNSESKLCSEIKKYGKKIMLHYGGGSIKKSGLYGRTIKALRDAGIEYVELGGVQPNPKLDLVKEGIKICRDDKIDFILAVGGGSTIDSAKGIAMGVPYKGDVWDFYSYKANPVEVLPVGVILTLPAAGSESSYSTVVTNDEGCKRAFDDNSLRPKFAILNPELTFSLPPYQTACGVTDIMVHIIERYFTNTMNVELTDRLCEAALKTVMSNAPIALEKPDDYAARSEIMWTGSVAHNNLLSTGRIGDWASHMIEHELSGINDVAHGAGLAIIVPAWMKYVYKHDVNRFVQFATRVMNVEQSFQEPEKTALEGIKRLKDFFRSIGMPTSLKEIGIGEGYFEKIAVDCRKFDKDTVGNFVKLGITDIINVLKLAN